MLKKIPLNQHAPFWLFTLSVLIGLTLPTLIQDGMFMDAMLYTSVSHNLSMGIGTFWFPQFSLLNVAGLSAFHEQPPLVFGIQSLFYKLLGDSMYVERFYTFITMCITALLIIILWKQIFKNQNEFKNTNWLPIFFWITIPVCFWSYSNNMHENTMGIFTITSVLLTYIAFRSTKFQIILLILSGVFVFLATLSKGIPGFFPIATPILYGLITKKISVFKSFFQTIIIMLVPVIIYVILCCFPESKESLSIYFFKRVIHRINEDPTVGNRFYILGRLFMELIPQLILVLVFFYISKIKKIALLSSEYIRESVFFVSIGLSASTPLMLTLVQKGFYFTPSLPFFAIGLSIFIIPVIAHLVNCINTKSKKYKMFMLLCISLFAGTTTFSLMQKGKVSRNPELLHDVYLIGSIVPKHSIVSIPAEYWNNWDLQCYLSRYFNISLETNIINNFCIIDKSTPANTFSNYKKVKINTLQYHLYKRL
jgi:4-amino-4-deoxy-L-arabinose transferase-like glycosyltransferase